MKTTTETFREAVVNWIKANKYSSDKLAIEVGCSPSALYKFLRGETENITLDRALTIARHIGYQIEV